MNMKPLLRAENLTKEFVPRGVSRSHRTVRALEEVSLAIKQGTHVAIVGGSGSGKSTLAACLAFLEEPTSGKIHFEGREATTLTQKDLRSIRPQVQLVFQDSANAFNPDFTVLQALGEPLLLHFACGAEERYQRASVLLERMGLQTEMLGRKTGELSGGQRQRIAIARALALEPKVLILDEALSALDSSVQARIANLLLDLADPSVPLEMRPAIVSITHDLAMAARVADEMIVMHEGRIVESGPPNRILEAPSEEATRALIAASLGAEFGASPELSV